MTIRRAEKGDIEKVLDLLTQVGNVHSALRPDLFVKDGTKYSHTELEELFKDNEKPVFVYINDENELCGYAFCMVESVGGNGNILVPHTSVYIDDICVDEAHRHEHIASALYEYVCSYAKQIGCYNITLNVWEGNAPAISFYKSRGMKVMKTVMETVL